jgi:hypothetical protein
MFYFGRESQGAEGRIYPYPLYDNLTNRRGEQTYRLVYLENEYVKIGILPEIGGRLFSAVDKTNNYDFIYHQHVIKPALIGLIGAWISGGIEWNIPHHHRASTFSPVQYRTEENADGSKTIWVGELEDPPAHALGRRLHAAPGQLRARMLRAHPQPHAEVNTMLCFANVAVHTNDNYQIIFPPEHAVGDASRQARFTTWPIATQPYGGVNWDHVDVSWYKNHQGANSMFAWNYHRRLLRRLRPRQGGRSHEHRRPPHRARQEILDVGHGPRGRMWDEILTDNDGPYIELMVGAYSDNQPDYSWLQPFEARSFQMNWYPFRDIGGVKNANLDAAVNLEVKDGRRNSASTPRRPTPPRPCSSRPATRCSSRRQIAIDPAKPYTKQVAVPAGTDRTTCAPRFPPAAANSSPTRRSG